MDFQKCAEYVEAAWNQDDGIQKTLENYIRIENQSPHFDVDWRTNGLQEQAAELLVDWVKRQQIPGLVVENVKLNNDTTPLIFIEIPGEGDQDKPVLLYGHFDKQPPLTQDWEAGLHPYTPVIKDGKLYGRGGADDGYSVFAAITAIGALKAQGIPHSRCVVIIEGSEESGSLHLPMYVDHFAQRIGTPSLIVCLDSGSGNYEQFWLTTSLRGIIVGTLRVELLKEGVHSGKASGVVPSTFRILRKLMSRIEDQDTGKILLDDLFVEVPLHRLSQTEAAAEVLKELIVDEFPFVDGGKAVDLPYPELLLNKTWRPALSTVGVDGMPSLENAGNVLRRFTSVQLSMRVPPTLNAKAGAEAMKKVLEQDPPYNAKVSFNYNKSGNGWDSPHLHDWLRSAVEESGERVFGKPTQYSGEGGSIPFMGMLAEKFPEAQFVVTGILGPNSNAHGPNEFLHIDYTKKVICCIANILHCERSRAK